MTGSLSVILTTPKTSPMWPWSVKMMSAAVRSDDSTLVTKCLDFCQALTNMGQTFNISLSIGSSFSFSLDTRRNVSHDVVTKKKRPSPSRLRRNQRRKEEFLKRKADPPPEKECEAFTCEECGNSYKSENGLKIHKGKAHKKVNTLPSPEKIRSSSGDSPLDSSLNVSPVRDTGREEVHENEAEEERKKEVSPFILALSKTLSLWPEDEEKHKCPSWREGLCRNLKCLLESEKESREYDAAGYCDNCEENKNDCECDQDPE